MSACGHKRRLRQVLTHLLLTLMRWRGEDWRANSLWGRDSRQHESLDVSSTYQEATTFPKLQTSIIGVSTTTAVFAERRFDFLRKLCRWKTMPVIASAVRHGMNHQMSPPHTKKPLHFQSSKQTSSGCQRRLLFSLKEYLTFSESSADEK